MTTSAQAKSNRSAVHELTPVASCEDRARQSFVFHTKRALGKLTAGPLARLGAGDDPAQITDALEASTSFAVWTSMNQAAQRQMWRCLGDMIDRQNEALLAKAEAVDGRSKLGDLTLDPSFEIPQYLVNTAFHGQPGGYVAAHDEKDLRAGLLQEAGGALYTRGAGTGGRDSKAQAVVDFIANRFSSFSPGHVLDIGCGFGGQTCGYAAAYPKARIDAIDVGPAALRFGHLRAESMELAIHFHQMDATATSFEDQSFDLIVSNILLHEVPTDVLSAIMKESFRLLRPGGIVIHQDVPTQRPDLPAFQQAMSSWQTAHNDEPYWDTFAATSVPEHLQSAGFDAGHIFEDYVRQIHGPLTWYFVGAQK